MGRRGGERNERRTERQGKEREKRERRGKEEGRRDEEGEGEMRGDNQIGQGEKEL